MRRTSKPTYQTAIAASSLVLGPLLMSIGDLLHPKEELDAADQAAIIIEHASRWYVAHLLLFFGILAFVPGLLALTSVMAARSPRAGYAARRLLAIGAAAFAGVFVGEMMIGRYVSDGADAEATTDLLNTFQSGWILGAILVGGVAFFLGVAVSAFSFMSDTRLRWPALALLLGALLILAEIISAQVVFSQAGNLVIFGASTAFAWLIMRDGLPMEPSAADS